MEQSSGSKESESGGKDPDVENSAGVSVKMLCCLFYNHMVYAEELSGKQEEIILSAFLKGCHRERPFTEQQIEVFPYLYAIVSAFWLMDVNRLINSIKAGKSDAAHAWMEEIQKRLTNHKRMPL